MIAALSSLSGAALLSVVAGQGAAARDAGLTPFEGAWNTSAAGCVDPETRHWLVIAPKELVGDEWGADLVRAQWDRQGRATADIVWWDINDTDAVGLPIRRHKTWRFSLSSDRQALTIRFDDHKNQTYVRCRRSRL